MYTPFTKNREELLKTNLSGKVMLAILKHPEARSLFSDEHLFLDGAWIKVQAFMNGFQSNERAPHRQTRPPLPLSPSPKKVAHGYAVMLGHKRRQQRRSNI